MSYSINISCHWCIDEDERCDICKRHQELLECTHRLCDERAARAAQGLTDFQRKVETKTAAMRAALGDVGLNPAEPLSEAPARVRVRDDLDRIVGQHIGAHERSATAIAVVDAVLDRLATEWRKLHGVPLTFLDRIESRDL